MAKNMTAGNYPDNGVEDNDISTGQARPARAPPDSSARQPPTLFTDGSWLDQVHNRLAEFGYYRAETILIFPMAVCLFLLGVLLYRAGAFAAGEHGSRIRRRMLLIGLAGLPVNLVAGLSGNPDWFLVDRYLLPPVVALLYIGLVGWWLDLRAAAGPGWVQRRLVTVGRMALSAYVFQNIVASMLCYGWGFGLAARFGVYRVPGTIAVWLVTAALVVLACELWSRRFTQGPVEWVWKYAYQVPRRISTRISTGGWSHSTRIRP